MEKRFFSFLFLLICALSIAAQKTQSVEKEIEKIQRFYTEISQKIKVLEEDEEQARTGNLAVNELVINKANRSWAAVGNYRVTYRFFYQNRGEEPYPTGLVKVTRTAEIAARRYFEEYVYNGAGALMFYFERSEDGEFPEERRVYFAGGKAIRLSEDKNTRDKLSAKDLETVRRILQNSSRLKDIFLKSVEG